MKKTIIAYFSASGVTKSVALKMKDVIGCDIFEITPVNIYTNNDLNWNDKQSRSSKEMEDKSARPKVLNKLNNVADYDNVVVAFPIWWGVAAWPTNTFVKANDFNGKTVIPFCTSSSSSIGDSGKLLEEQANGGNWLEGHRFSSNASEDEIISWINSL